MDYLQILRMWLRLERCTSGVRRSDRAAGTTLSVTSSGHETLALCWRSEDPLAVRVTVLAGLGCTSAVVSREALRAVANSGFGRHCRLVVAGCALRPTRSCVRRLLAATDAAVPCYREAAVVDAAAQAFLHSVLGPVAPRP